MCEACFHHSMGYPGIAVPLGVAHSISLNETNEFNMNLHKFSCACQGLWSVVMDSCLVSVKISILIPNETTVLGIMYSCFRTGV